MQVKLQDYFGLEDFTDNEILRIMNDLTRCKTYRDLSSFIKKCGYITKSQKLALLKYFNDNDLYTPSLYKGFNLMNYVRRCLKYLPLTKRERMEVEYEFSKINKDRFKDR